MRKQLTRIALGVAWLAVPLHVSVAHHSFATHYNLQREIVLVGTLTEVTLRNPHSFFSVEVMTEEGSSEIWEVESQSIANLRRAGLDNDTLKTGDQVVFRGTPSLDPQKRLMFANTITPPGRGAMPTASYVRLINQRSPDNRPGVSGVDRFTGIWIPIPTGGAGVGPSPMPLNEVGRAAHEAFETRSASAADCKAPNLPAILIAPYLYEISHTNGRVTLSHEYNDIVRDFELDSADSTISDPDFGARTGSYENGRLTVTSTGFPELTAGLASSWEANGNGADVPSSEQKLFVERYSLNDDGSLMRLEYTVTDPAYMTGAYSRHLDFVRVPFNTPIYEFNCDADVARRSMDHAVL